jgi:hypothetical protein
LPWRRTLSDAFALSFAAMLHQLRGEVALCLERAEAALALATEQFLPHWAARATAGNIFAYGMLLQTNEIDLPAGATEEVTCLRFGPAMRRKVSVPEEDTRLTCVPLAGLVAAGGRLLLARLHRAVAERGGTMALWVTDSGHPVATREGGMIEIERHGAAPGAGMPHGRIRALSWREVDEIAAPFRQAPVSRLGALGHCREFGAGRPAAAA